MYCKIEKIINGWQTSYGGHNISGFDIFVLTVVGLTSALGLWKGLTSQVFGLGGLICGYMLSTRYYLKIAGLLPDINQGTAKIIGFLSIFMACIIIAFLFGSLVSKLLKIAGLGWANRIMGGLLGLVKGTLIVTIALVILIAFLPSGNDLMKGSITMPYIVSGSKFIGAAIPNDIKSKYKSRIELLEMLKKSGEKN